MRHFCWFTLCLILIMGVVALAPSQDIVMAQDPPEDRVYESLDGSFTFNYPPTWVIDDTIATLLAANNVTVLDKAAEDFVPGDVRLQIIAPQFTQWLLRIELGVNAETAMNTLVTSLNASVTAEGIRQIEAARPIYRADLTADPTFDVMALTVEAGDGGIGLIIAFTAPGQIATVETQVYALAESMQFVQPTLDPATLGVISPDRAEEVELLAMWGGHTNWISRLDLNDAGTQLVSLDGNSGIRVWDIASGLPVASASSELAISAGPLMTNDGQVVLGTSEGLIWVWDPETLSRVRDVNTTDATIWTMRFNADRSLLATGGQDAVVHIFDFASGAEQGTLLGHTDEITDVVFSPDGTRLYSSSWDETIKVWDVESGSLIFEIEGPSGGIATLDISPDGARLAAGGLDSNVYIYDATSSSLLFTLPEHLSGQPVVSVSFAPEGRLLVSGAQDSTIIVWDTETGLPLLAARGPSWMNDVKFSDDGKLIFAANDAGVIMVWGIQE